MRVGLIDVSVKTLLSGVIRLQWVEGASVRQLHLNEREAETLHAFLGQELLDLSVMAQGRGAAA